MVAESGAKLIINKINAELIKRGLQPSFVPAINPHSTIAMVLFNRVNAGAPFELDAIRRAVMSIRRININSFLNHTARLEPMILRYAPNKNISRLTIMGYSSAIGELRRRIKHEHQEYRNSWETDEIDRMAINLGNGYMIQTPHQTAIFDIVRHNRNNNSLAWNIPRLKLVYHADSTLNPKTNIWEVSI